MMRGIKLGLIVLAAALLTLGLGGLAYAFHSGGVAECAGCHSMHSSAPNGSFLLVGTDQSSTCLTCHENAADTGPSSYHISTAGSAGPAMPTPLQRTPGGDFGWIKKDFTYPDSAGVALTEEGQRHGHNIVAVDKGYAADTLNTTAPGGTFPSGQLACSSCHDPHGQYRRLPNGTISKTGGAIMASGSYATSTNPVYTDPPAAGLALGVYRLLAGAGYTKGPVTFNGVPSAKAPSTYNRTEATTQTRVAYGTVATSGHASWGDWCLTCHGTMQLHSATASHPVDQGLGSTTATNYRQYVKTGDMTGTTNGFLSLVPFIQSSTDYTGLIANAKNDNTVLTGPLSTDQVSCLSCHRAHASGWLHALRYDVEYEFMVVNGKYVASDNGSVTGSRAGLQHRGRTEADVTAAYYGRPATPTFATYQRVLCNKCHAKD